MLLAFHMTNYIRDYDGEKVALRPTLKTHLELGVTTEVTRQKPMNTEQAKYIKTTNVER